MTKIYTKAGKRRVKQSAMPGLAETPKRKARGHKRMAEIKAEPEAQKTVLEARARHAGATRRDLTDMRHPAYGEPAGRAIYALHGPDTAKRAWDAYAGLTAAEARYASAYLGMRLNSKTAQIKYLAEVFEARADHAHDPRTEEERSRDASNAWMRWRGYLMQLPRHQQQAITDVAYGSAEPMAQGKATALGERFALAAAALADVVDRTG